MTVVPVWLRRVVPLVVALAMIANAAAAWAAADVRGRSYCCCPDPKACPCNDHGAPRAPELQRCGRDAIQAALPDVMPAVIPGPVRVLEAVRVVAPVMARVIVLVDGVAAPPELPPP